MLKFRQKDGSTRRITAQGEKFITTIYGDVMRNGSFIEKFNYTNIKGYSEQEIANIAEDLCALAENKDTAILKTINYLHKIIDYGA